MFLLILVEKVFFSMFNRFFAHKLNPQKTSTPNALFTQGNDARKRGDFLGAIAAYAQALSIRTEFHQALNSKGEVV